MAGLNERRCRPCEGGVEPLTRGEATALLHQVSGWDMIAGGRQIRRSFEFKDHWETMAFVNAIAWISHSEDHHPDLEVGYRTCVVKYMTHAIGGLSENDFICAAKVDQLLSG